MEKKRCVWVGRLLLAVGLGVVGLAPARGAVLYNEAVSGDLKGNQGSPSVLGPMWIGLNEILGHDSIASDGPGGQGDSFTLTLGAGQVLTSVKLTVTNYVGSSFYVATFFKTSPAFGVLQRTSPRSGNGVYDFTVPVGLTPQALGFSVQVATLPSPDFDWKWDLMVASSAAPVPEAGSVQLLGAGLAVVGGLVGWRRRRARG